MDPVAYEGEVRLLQARLDEAQRALEAVLRSRSWRLTRPLRVAGKVLRALPFLHRRGVAPGTRPQRRLPSPLPLDRELAGAVEASGLFDRAYYLAHNPDAAGVDALAHYLAHGGAQPWRPVHPAFDPDFYRTWNADLRPGVSPLVDYVTRFLGPPAARMDAAERQRLVEELNRTGRASREADEPPQVSIIIPACNRIDFTLRCLHALSNHPTKYRYEILVVDDGSGDATPEVLSQLAGVRFLRHGATRGFARSCNHGAAQARGQYLVFLHNDTRVLPGWLDELIDAGATVPGAGVVCSKLLEAGGRLHEAGGVLLRDGSARRYGQYDLRDKPEYNYLREVDCCSGVSVAVARGLWEAIGGFDEGYARPADAAADLAVCAQERGHKVLYQPLSAVVHWTAPGPAAAAGAGADLVDDVGLLFSHHRRFLAALDPRRERDRRARGRILFVDDRTPTPDRDSGSLTTLDFLRACQRAGYQASFAPEGLAVRERYTADLQRRGVECLYRPYQPSLEAHLQAAGGCYDLIVLLRAPMAIRYLYLARQYAPQAQILFHTVDLHYLREQRQAALENDAGLARAASLTRARELAMILAADCTVVVSQFEKDLLASELPRANVYVFPYVREVAGCRNAYEGRRDILFVGGYDHRPNVDAVRYFVEEVFPRVRARVPGVRFLILGSNPPAEVLGLAREGVEVVGYVPELAPYLDRCRLSVAPLRYGAGIKGKVVMSLSFGVPAVTTSVAAEGMGLRHGQEVLIADDAPAFADAVVRLYGDKDLWERLSANGLEFVRCRYSPEAGQRHVRAILGGIGLAPVPACPPPLPQAA
jgi:glycosyltransferase involved in cell wall biosynthesis